VPNNSRPGRTEKVSSGDRRIRMIDRNIFEDLFSSEICAITGLPRLWHSINTFAQVVRFNNVRAL
jgi:hypothetical protein